MTFAYDEAVENWSTKDFNFSYSVSYFYSFNFLNVALSWFAFGMFLCSSLLEHMTWYHTCGGTV